MRVLISGASGTIGVHLQRLLRQQGHETVRLVRRRVLSLATEIFWDPVTGTIDRETVAASRIDAAVHLSGRSLLGVWTERHKQLVRKSRIDSGRLLARTLAALEIPPAVYVSISALGWYGDRGDEQLDESSPPGTGFLAELCRDWEASAEPARQRGIRVVHPRIGVVLSPKGGFLAPLLPIFRLGLGASPGSGKQWFGWIHGDDAMAAILLALERTDLAGPVNLTAPHPVRLKEFTRTLARLLHRPALLSIPAPLVKLLPGGMGQEMLLLSQRVVPGVLQRLEFPFAFEELEPALVDILAELAR